MADDLKGVAQQLWQEVLQENEAKEQRFQGAPISEREFIKRGVEGDLDPKFRLQGSEVTLPEAKAQLQEKQEVAQSLGFRTYQDAFEAFQAQNPDLSLVEIGDSIMSMGKPRGDTIATSSNPQDMNQHRQDFSEAEIDALVEKNQHSGAKFETSKWDAAKKSFVTSDVFTYNLGNLVGAATGVLPEWQWGDSPLNLFQHRIVSTEEIYGPEFKNMSFEERRLAIKERRDRQVNEFYGHIESGRHPGTELAASFAGYATDPTTLAPIGKTIPQAAAIGGGIVGTDVALHELAQTGEVNAVDVAIGATLGAILGPVVKVIGDKAPGAAKEFMGWTKEKIARGEPITGDDILRHADSGKESISVTTANKIADEVNVAFELSPQGYLQQSIDVANRTLRGKPDVELMDPEVAIFFQRQAGSDVTLTTPQKMKAIENEKTFSDLNGTTFAGPEAISKEVDAQWGRQFEQNPSKSVRKTQDPKRKAKKIAKAKADAKKQRGEAAMMHPKNAALRDAIALANADRAKVLNDDFLSSLPRDDNGNVTQKTLENFGVGTWSKATGDSEGDILRALTFEDIPTGTKVGRELWGNINKKQDPDAPVTPEQAQGYASSTNLWRWTQRPTARFSQVFGQKGKILNEVLDRHVEDTRWWTAQTVNKIHRDDLKGIRRGSQEYDQVADVLRGILKPSQVSKQVAEAASSIRGRFNSALRLAQKHGIVTREKANFLINKAKTEGYFPHVYNHAKLNSSRGAKEWEETLMRHEWTPEQVDNALSKILKLDAKAAARVKSGFKKNGEVYTITKEFARKLLDKERGLTHGAKSRHLEEDRTILLPEYVLKPFLLSDIQDVSTEYFRDVYNRVASAKWFGKDYERVQNFIDEVTEFPHVTSQDTDNVWEVVWGLSGDSQARATQAYLDLPAAQRGIMSKITAYETFKLTFAQVAGFWQATINGNIYLSSRAGLLNSTKIYAKGIRDLFKGDARKLSDDIGSSAETTLMEVAGEMGSNMNRWSTKFLRGTGFLAVEKLQRRLAANMGRAYTQHMMDTRAKLLLTRKRRKLSNKEKSLLQKTEDGMTEMGISLREGDPRISAQDMNRSMQRFSNSVNFTATAHKLPIGTQTPYWKIARQFKSFAFFQGAFIKDNVIKPAMKGDFRPAFVLLGAGGLGMGTDEIRRFLKADDQEFTMLERYGRGFMAIGGLGIMLDTVNQVKYGKETAVAGLLGPAVGDIASVVEGGYKIGAKALEGEAPELEDASRIARKLFVYPGEGIQKRILEEKKSLNYESLYDEVYK